MMIRRGASQKRATIIRICFVIPYTLPPFPTNFSSPDAGAQTFQLHDLTVMDKQVHFGAVILDVPREHIGIGDLEHQFFHADLVDEFRGNVRAPSVNIFRDALALDHNDLRAGFENRFACAIVQLGSRVPSAFSSPAASLHPLQIESPLPVSLSIRISARIHQPQPVISRD